MGLGLERRWEENTLQVHFVTTTAELIDKQERYNILEQKQRVVQHFQDISTLKRLYIACYSRLELQSCASLTIVQFNHMYIPMPYQP